MSTFWTPDGERPVNPQQSPSDTTGRAPTGFDSEPSREEAEAQLEQLRKHLAETPASIVIANHCFGLFELAALHLSTNPPKLSDAQLAIDALGALVENLTGRLDEAEPQLREGLAQLRTAFVQIRAQAAASDE